VLDEMVRYISLVLSLVKFVVNFYSSTELYSSRVLLYCCKF
jgi:hypothetical protein